jgi:two-component system, LuxR family, response regulator FixJ
MVIMMEVEKELDEVQRKPMIFLVDDEPAVCKAIAQTLEEVGYRVRLFLKAGECLRVLEKRSCDLLIADVNMPEMDGIELLKAVKLLRPLLPVLLITGYGDIPIAVKAVKAGAYDFVEKPLDEETFIPLVKEAIMKCAKKNAFTGKPLTKTEKKILQLVVDGMGNKQIASTLECSVRTVENHRYRISKKLNVDSTASLVRLSLTMGIASADPSRSL